MHKPHIEYEICLSGDIKLPLLENWKYLRNNKKITNNYKATYLDDDDLYLLKNRLGLRLRYENTVWVQTLKFEKFNHTCIEWNSNLNQTVKKHDPQLNPMALPNLQMLRKNGCFLKKDLKLISTNLKDKFTITTKRFSWISNFKESIIEVSFDSGWIHAKRHKEKISEVELELIRGEPYQVWLLAKEMIQLFPNLVFQYRSKAFRGFLLSGFNWRLLQSSKTDKKKFKKVKFELLLRELILKKNKTLSFFFQLLIDNKKKQFTEEIVVTLNELRYLFQLLIIIRINQNKKDLKLLKSLKYRCTNIVKTLKKVENIHLTDKYKQTDKSLMYKSLSNVVQELIADLGLFANKNSLLDSANANSYVNDFFLKFEKHIDRRICFNQKNVPSNRNKRSYNLITYNSYLLETIGVAAKIISKNRQLDFDVEKQIKKLNYLS